MYAGESCQHLIITDEREGTEICVICSKVINDCLMIPPKSYTFNNPSKSCAFHEFIRDCCDRIHVLDGDIEKCIICFDEFVQEIKQHNFHHPIAKYCKTTLLENKFWKNKYAYF